MRRLRHWQLACVFGGLSIAMGAAPAAPSYHAVQRPIDDIRKAWATPNATADPNAPGWNAFFNALLAEFNTYSNAQDSNAQLVSLNRLYQMSVALQSVEWPPAVRVREELRNWLRPRVRVAWAERRLLDAISGLATSPDPAVRSNRDQWVRFVDDGLGAALRQYDGAKTVAQRAKALKQVHEALNSLRNDDQRRSWVPSIALQQALDDLYNQPNLDVSADVATLAPVLNQNLVTTGPIERKGYISQVTAGPKTGFGLLHSDDGIAFYNSQLMTSVTPIWDFYNKMQQDQQGRRAAKLYVFGATSVDSSELTVTAVLRPSGLSLQQAYAHNTNATITSDKTQGNGLGRAIAALVGYNQPRITQKVYDGAIGDIRQNVVTESAELGGERIAQAQAEQNAKLGQYLIGNNTLAIRNLLITGLLLRSRPENALISGTLQWKDAGAQVGADAPQPVSFEIPDAGVSADLHLSSIMTSLTRGYLQSDAARSIENLMIVTKKIPPDAPPSQGIVVSRNVNYPEFLKAVETAEAAHDPKVMAIRVKRPGHSPDFAADASGNLVALVHDFLIEVPAPEQMARGEFGAKAKILRISSPEAEFVISFKITPQTEKEPVRLSGRIESFDPGIQGRVYAVAENEGQATQMNPFTSRIILGVFSSKLQGQPVNIPLSNLKLQGFAINSVSPLDPTGWIRVNLVRTSESPAAGVH